MTFKKNNPGCPCDCGEIPPTGPCGCDATQIQIDVTDADDIITIQGVRFIGGPCDYLDFTGFSAIEGTYYVDWPYEGGEIELGRWAATNGPLTDALGTKYCVYAQLKLSVPSVPGGDACDGFLCLCIHVETLFSGSTCPSVDDITFTSCLLLNCGSFTEDNDVELAICIGDTQSVSQPTTDDTDCAIKYYDWTATWAPA